jgi:hypothetical protein
LSKSLTIKGRINEGDSRDDLDESSEEFSQSFIHKLYMQVKKEDQKKKPQAKKVNKDNLYP